jgi:tyrosine recombinase XerC
MQTAFDRFIDYLKAERNASRHTVRNYTADLQGNYKRGMPKGFLQFLMLKRIESLRDVDKNTLRDYMAWLAQQGVAKASIARKLSAIRSFYRYLLREEIISESPMPLSRQGRGRLSSFSIKLDRRLPSFLTRDEATELLESRGPVSPRTLRDIAFLELLYASGLRVSELTKLDLEQVNLDTREIRVWGKGSKERITLMGEPAVRALAAYLTEGRPRLLGNKESSALFLNRSGRRLTERSVQIILGKYARAVGIEKRVHPHMLRHTFATHLLDGGADLRVVQELLGHASLSSTQIYTHVSKTQAKKVYLAAHPLAQEGSNESKDE